MTIPLLPRGVLAATLMVSATLGLGACGSTDTASTATRGAAADTSCPTRSSSVVSYIRVVNELGTDVVLDVPRSSWVCDGYSGTATPGALDGRTVGHPAGQTGTPWSPLYTNWRASAFTLNLRAGNGVLASLRLALFPILTNKFALGIETDGKYWCDEKPVQFRDLDGQTAWAIARHCQPGEKRELLLTKVKPWER